MRRKIAASSFSMLLRLAMFLRGEQVRAHQQMRFQRGGWPTRLVASTRLTST
jgi:hypothetical protein